MTTQTPSGENRLQGILWMLATMLCFIILDAAMKYALETYSLVQVTWGRFFFASIFAILTCARNLPRFIKTSNPGGQLARSILLMATTGLFAAGVARLPLATATAIMFLSPILVTLLSIAILKEDVGLRRWLGIATGFAGAIIIVQPWNDREEAYLAGALLLLAASFTNACYQIATRQVRDDDPLTSLLFTASAGAIATSLILPWHWTMPDTIGWLLLIGCGAMGCLGHLCLIKAFQAAPASVVAPYSYSSLIWASLFGFLIWQEIPDRHALFGAALIVTAGLYIFFRERKLQQPEVKQFRP